MSKPEIKILNPDSTNSYFEVEFDADNLHTLIHFETYRWRIQSVEVYNCNQLLADPTAQHWYPLLSGFIKAGDAFQFLRERLNVFIYSSVIITGRTYKNKDIYTHYNRFWISR